MERKPAHIVISELLEGTVAAMVREYEVMGKPDTIYKAELTGKIVMGIETLRKMIIPEKHLKEVAETLEEIRKRCPAPACAQIFMGMSIVPDIIPAPSEPTEPAHLPEEMPIVATDQTPT
ncbi:MAG: hypothetical protein D4Q79_00895 [Spirochaetia bacterium]|nr:MAG: hypothetical protein D4Q79_00895 [Spirochaetia bacterium]